MPNTPANPPANPQASAPANPASITRLTATIQATQPVAWPHYAGSTLRGAFGRALRITTCITELPTCNGCAVRQNCGYGVVFDPAPPLEPLHPSFRDGLPRYFVQAPAIGAAQLGAGDTQQFTLVLLPGTHNRLSLLGYALRKAVEQELIKHGMFKVTDIRQEQQAIHLTATPADSGNNPKHIHANTISLRWHTPLRLVQKGKPLMEPQQLDSITLVRALLRRQLQWCQLSQQPVPDSQALLQAASQCTLNSSNMRWHAIQRHSSTQNQKIPLSGLMGSAQLHGPAQALETLLPLLQLGEQLHIGKDIVMGLGRYQLSLH